MPLNEWRMPGDKPSLDELLTDEIAKFNADPFGYVMFNFPWTEDASIQMVKLQSPWKERVDCEYGPDLWACEFLDELGYEIKKRAFDGKHAVEPIRFTTASGHGVGKSTLVAWLIKFITDTRPFAKGVVTANTSEQLRTKTWAELAKWNGSSLTAHLWHYTTGRGSMSFYRRGNKKIQANWRCDAQTCREENAEAFQGLHAANSTPFYIFDEASGIPDKIFEARSGGATDGEPMIFDFGNPTRKSGMFYENCIGKYRHRFIARSIDSRSVMITNKKLIKEWADDWGEDSDFFKVKVRGVFPSQGSTQFISNDLVREAMLRPTYKNDKDPLIIGVDVARFGNNSTVIYPRIGMDARSFAYKEYKGLDIPGVCEKVVEMIRGFQAIGKKVNGLFIDAGGLGGGVYDILNRLGYNPIAVNFGNTSSDPAYRFMGDKMWGKLRDALPRLALPYDDKLNTQLTQREYGFTGSGKIQLESKESLQERRAESPDIADGLALTFASEVSGEVETGLHQYVHVSVDYDPLETNW